MKRNNPAFPFLVLTIFIFWIQQAFGLKNVLVMHDGGAEDLTSLVLVECQDDIKVSFVDVTPADSHKKPAAWLTKLCLDYLYIEPTDISANDFEGFNKFPETWRNDAKILSELPIFNNTKRIHANRIFSTKATERLAHVLSGNRNYTLLITGPFSNLAAAITRWPAIINNIEKIYAMGGAIRVPGNVHINNNTLPAEWNIYNNPQAADKVFRSGIPITLIPLDVTNKAPVTKDFLRSLYSQHSHTANLISAIYKVVENLMEDKAYFWDSLAAGALIDPTLFQTEKMNIRVILAGEAQGQTEVSNSGTTLEVATNVDLGRFQTLMFSSLRNCKKTKQLQEPSSQNHRWSFNL